MRHRLSALGLALLASAHSAIAVDAPAAGTPPAPPSAPPKCEEHAPPPPVRILSASDPAAARRAEDQVIAEKQQSQAPEGETAEAQVVRSVRVEELKKLARDSKVAAFDPALFESTRTLAREQLVAAEERLRLAKKAWAKPPAEDELVAAQAAYCTSQLARDQAAQAETLAGEAVKQAAAATALSELMPKRLEDALRETDATQRAALIKTIEDSKLEIGAAKERAFDKWLDARRALAPATQERAKKALSESTDASGGGVVLRTGTRLSWGVTSSILRFRTERNPNLPGRDRNFRARYEFVPAEAGFQFLSEPDGLPWRLQLKDGGSVQIVSWGGMLLAGLGKDSKVERGNLSLAGTLAFFENTIGLGVGFDLYRGIPIQGADGTSGSDTAFTGVLAWAFAPEGEVTAENAFVVVTVNLSTIIKAISGQHEGE